MNSLLEFIPELPVAEWMAQIVQWLTIHLNQFFDAITDGGQTLMNWMTSLFQLIPPIVMIVLVAFACFWLTGKKYGLAIFSIIGLIYIYNQGLWEDMLFTLALIIVASFISIILGIPLGILMAKSDIVNSIMQPILDFMQTMPAFVYLIPSVAFFGIGMVPGVFASVIFALPPIVRFTNLGIRQVPLELMEAATSFGSTSRQKLFKLELPMAMSTIMAGVNQTVLLALSMVVTASMIGAPGLGYNVLSALQRGQVGSGFVSGFALVALAIMIDRMLQASSKRSNVNEEGA